MRIPILALLLSLASPSRAENLALVCEAPPDDYTELDDFRLTRAASLDIRGLPPSLDDLAQVELEGDLSDTILDDWLNSPEFATRAVRHHRELLLNSLDNLRTFSTRALLSVGTISYRTGAPAILYRGANVRCLDEPARFDDDGAILTTLQANGNRLEGWVQVSPYWAPTTLIKVCAFDAQDAIVSPQGTQCGSLDGLLDTSCGCGPELRYCGTGAIELTVARSLAEDLDRRLRDVFENDRSYLDLFFSSKAYVNGPLVHYYRHILGVAVQGMQPSPVDLDRLPNLEYSDTNTWVEIDLGEHHAGILTSTAFLLKFQTNRARANQFFLSFLCQPFDSPGSGISLIGRPEPDLQEREGCSSCHAILEPAAAFWGRWGERGAAYLSPLDYPSFDNQCLLCAETGFGCTSRCRNRYIVDALEPEYEPFLGHLRPYAFLLDEHEPHLEDGPRLFVRHTLADGRLPKCVAQHVAERMLGREIDKDKEATLVNDLASVFVNSGYRYREVFRAMVAHPTYRRVR